MAESTQIDPATLLPHASIHTMPHASPVDLMALVQDYRTGYLLVDVLLCLLVPLLIQQLLSLLQGDGDTGSLRLFTTLWAWLSADHQEEVVERTIEITQRFNRDGHKVWDWEQKNHLLQKAISLYLSYVLNLDNKDAKYELLEKPRKQTGDTNARDEADSGSVTSNSSYYTDEEEDYDDGVYCGEVDKLSVESLPLTNTWITVAPGIQFMHEEVSPENPGDHKGVTETKVIYRLQSKLKDGSDRIEEFIEKAYANYQEMERRKVHEDKSRYFYIQSGSASSSSTAEGGAKGVVFKRYALGEEKTFENLFFDEKQQVIQLLDNFANKTGKFSIKGFPYKLGFLLHGPPGTGKTSLIKAIAQYTKRHIVTINLGKIKSNQDLMDAMFDLKFSVNGLDSPVEYEFKDVIFVMEDIDCASSIVNKRTDADKPSDTKKEEEAKVKEAADGEEEELVEEEEGEETSTKKAIKTSDAIDDEKFMSLMLKLVMEDEKKHAKINLAGLLNVLDGVIDCPGRIIIMTTNHPEKLDPALIRPGRVNKKLLLSYMNATQVRKMIEYYSMTELTEANAERVDSIFARATKRVSPAEVEEMCAEYDSMDAILDGLESIACCTL